MPVRNADWALGLTARVALLWCDSLVVLLHACEDRSAEIVSDISDEHPGRVRILVEPSSIWDEMNYRQRMLDASREMGATHIAIVDADEILTGNLIETVRDKIAAAPQNCISMLPLYNLRGRHDRYHANGIWGERQVTMAFADAPHLHWTGDRWHHRDPMGAHPHGWLLLPQGAGGVMHLWGASERRLRAHHAHYKITERLRWPGKPVSEIDRIYSWAIHGPNDEAIRWAFAPTPAEWWDPYSDLMRYLDVNAEPWEEAECRRILAAHDRGRFHGLDLFGVAA